MSDLWNGPEIWYGLVANFFTLLLTLLITWLLYVFFGRRRLLKFFGADDVKILRIYVGHISNPNVPKGLVGFEEISEAKNIEALFKSVIPGLGNRGWLKVLQVADIQTEILPGEQGSANVTLHHSLVSLGAPDSNFASSLIEIELKSRLGLIQPVEKCLFPSWVPLQKIRRSLLRYVLEIITIFTLRGPTSQQLLVAQDS